MQLVTHVGTMNIVLIGAIAVCQKTGFSTGYTIQICEQTYVHNVSSLVCCSCRYRPPGPALGQHNGCTPRQDELYTISEGQDKGLTCPEQNDAAKQLGKRAERKAAPKRT